MLFLQRLLRYILIHGLFGRCPALFLLLISILIMLLSDNIIFIIFRLLNMLRCALCLECGLSWRTFYVRLKRMWIWQMLEGIFKLIDGAVQVNDILTDFLPAWSINCWQKAVEVPEHNSGLVCSPFRSISFMFSC